MAFAIKAAIDDAQAKTFVLSAQKTMYGGKHIAAGDTVFLFASENEGGQGLVARGTVTSAKAVAKKRGIERQTPRVSVTIKRTALARTATTTSWVHNHASCTSSGERATPSPINTTLHRISQPIADSEAT